MIANRIVKDCILELNESDKTQVIPTENGTCLYGENGYLDSLKLVWLISLLESKVEEELNVAITFADDKMFSIRKNPFKTILSLSQYVSTRIADTTETLHG